MLNRPPDTEFYDADDVLTLWYDQLRRYEVFCGPDKSQWAEKTERFLLVIDDIKVRIENSQPVAP